MTKDPASETKRNGRLWQAYSLPKDLQYTSSRLLFISCSSCKVLKANKLAAHHNCFGIPRLGREELFGKADPCDTLGTFHA